ncbi:hypothetical protein M878_10455 [Streptomyces roseochromogenus subsp. oscitans DS 12.976]|uniref:Uncharacterized protein n=1 Tax=Streptomyces roseochromogenus subsp. oscitans DS 12.976 TaxID=1352936 RepID=V6KQW3_STRRC|nr:hypothetical protein M878_10455 [Streptomyces roseochromogenus subsp. oscitans DS 12.976]
MWDSRIRIWSGGPHRRLCSAFSPTFARPPRLSAPAPGPELYEAVLAVRRAEAELFAMFTDADVIGAVRWRY